MGWDHQIHTSRLPRMIRNHMYTRLYQAPYQLCLTTSLLATDDISMRDHASSLLLRREEHLDLSHCSRLIAASPISKRQLIFQFTFVFSDRFKLRGKSWLISKEGTSLNARMHFLCPFFIIIIIIYREEQKEKYETRRSRSSGEEDLEVHCEVSVNGPAPGPSHGSSGPVIKNPSLSALIRPLPKRSTLARADDPQSPSSYCD